MAISEDVFVSHSWGGNSWHPVEEARGVDERFTWHKPAGCHSAGLSGPPISAVVGKPWSRQIGLTEHLLCAGHF